MDEVCWLGNGTSWIHARACRRRLLSRQVSRQGRRLRNCGGGVDRISVRHVSADSKGDARSSGPIEVSTPLNPDTVSRPPVASVVQPADSLTASPAWSIMFMLLRRLFSLWAVLFMAVSLLVFWLAPNLISASMLIAVASGFISAIALLPCLRRTNASSNQTTSGEQQVAAIFLSMAIRVLGTVALFLFCRYQMGLPPQTVALMVCGWYALLTSFEVFLLARSPNLLTTSTESTSE